MGGLSIHGNTRRGTAAVAYLWVVGDQIGGRRRPCIGERLTRRVIEDDAGKTSGRKDRLRGQMGVRTRALSDG